MQDGKEVGKCEANLSSCKDEFAIVANSYYKICTQFATIANLAAKQIFRPVRLLEENCNMVWT
jgi:hypothetical protein